MLNIVLAMAGSSQFFSKEDFPFPKPLIEIGGMPMIEAVVRNLMTINRDKRFIFILNEDDCRSFHLDKILRLISGGDSEILILNQLAQGAACSVLMSIDHINNDDSLLIVNSDQLFETDLNILLDDLADYDAGVACFQNIHPRWSYVRLDENNLVVEAAEKSPISRNAIAGFYYFAKGAAFVEAAMEMIATGKSHNDIYYVSPVYNELVLKGARIGMTLIDPSIYHSFYLPTKIAEFERQYPGNEFKNRFERYLMEAVE